MLRSGIKKRSSFFIRFLFSLNIFAAIFLGISYLAPLVSPANFWIVAFFGLAYPFLLLVNIAFLFFWLLKLNKRLLLSLIIILIGWNQIHNHFQIRFKQEDAKDVSKIKLMSYNVNIFSIYNEWNVFEKKHRILQLIKENKPDILCLQEFVNYSEGTELATIDSLQHILTGYPYYVEFTSTAKKISHFGSIILSRYPIINRGKIKFDNASDNISQFIDILIDTDTIRIYNVHLQSIKMKPEDYRFAEDISKIKNINKREQINKNLLRILNRLKHAFISRAPQSILVNESISNCPYPVIVCGDFNDTPASYAYHQIMEGLTDAFLEKGRGMGKTYLGVFPSFRIDYILHSKDFNTLNFNILKLKYSDHYPVISEVQLASH